MSDVTGCRRVLVWNPNPTLDVVNTVATLSPGDVHRADTQLLSAGGKGTLVVRALSLLGAACDGVAPLAGVTGSVVRDLFLQERLPFRTSAVSGVTRLAITVTEDRDSRDTVINGPGPQTDDDPWRAHLSAVMELIESGEYGYFVIAGRPPLSTPITDLLSLTHAAHANGLRTVYDMSSPTLEACLAGEPWLVKINVTEARQALVRQAAADELVRALMGRGARNVVLTDGPGTIHGSLSGDRFAARPPNVDVVSAVGGGDCFLAGLLFEISRGQTRVEEVIRTAAAVASASAENPQPGFFAPPRAEALRGSVVVYRRDGRAG